MEAVSVTGDERIINADMWAPAQFRPRGYQKVTGVTTSGNNDVLRTAANHF